MSELARRVASAACLIPLVAWGVIALPTIWLAVAIGLFAVAGAWEWAALAGWPSLAARASCAGGMLLLLLGAWTLLGHPSAVNAILLVACGFWVVALAWVVGYERGREPALLRNATVRGLAGVLLLVPCWLAVVWLHAAAGAGPWWVLGLLVVIWGADSGAYFAGRRFGRRRLAARVSPGKTIEGVAGGLAIVVAGAIAVGAWLGWPVSRLAGLAVLSLITALVSVLGDLAESLFKRRAGLKDSGVLIPGHGGVLDRIDSLMAAAPIFTLGHAMLDPGT